jgi:microcystin-dependent protein
MNTNSLLAPPLRIALASLFTLALCGPTLRAADGNPPERLTYQGYLVDTTGTALGTAAPKNYDVIFRIYNHESASGTTYRLWTELQTVTVDKGYFSVVLGEGGAYGTEVRPTPLSTVFTNALDASDRYIEMTVRAIGAGGADSTILPRLRLLTTPYAMLAKTAVNAKNLINTSGGQIVTLNGTNVGVNKALPTSALDVNGTVTATALNISGGVTLSGAVAASTVNATTVTGTAVNGATITASTAFVGPGTIPVGGIIMWSGSTPPTGWALCNGTSVNGVSTPDLRGRFIVASGAGTGLTQRSLGATGGEENHTLTASEMPVHGHGVTDPGHNHPITDPGHRHPYNYDATGWNGGNALSTDRYDGHQYTDDAYTGITINTKTTGISINTSGSGSAHNTMPPFYALAFIMRVQ